MGIEACQAQTNVPKVSVREGQRRATFLNPKRQVFIVSRVDGCIVTEGLRADWAVSKKEVGDTIIIELKGRDVDHAVKQIHATASLWVRNKYGNGKLAGLVVARQYPRASTGVQKAQQAFARTFKGPLHVVTQNREFDFEKVLQFEGPG
jgi:hypothetical protein